MILPSPEGSELVRGHSQSTPAKTRISRNPPPCVQIKKWNHSRITIERPDCADPPSPRLDGRPGREWPLQDIQMKKILKLIPSTLLKSLI